MSTWRKPTDPKGVWRGEPEGENACPKQACGLFGKPTQRDDRCLECGTELAHVDVVTDSSGGWEPGYGPVEVNEDG